ncbi:MAG: aminopeptidase P family protein [Nitrospinaceae bacterium]|jgi:Xaa-Pro aminopeptidase|nr:aminopeptidase P family protein [Nitrospinaceae bacterium]MBT3432427.1 aminopeptidase P family protein [Nitrospinaceae bacterium]MBT3821556.1 aminopeptidase P family protein [Nitrospinaceae bacterium]MBT4430853.1 aminopeptidase P family protein [Nitrospinaceae bacterium]MBT5946066.1 aminopeptidase P family protein [Nitrospinaceae bacterium]
MDLPYDSSRLDRLMDEAGADVLLVGTRHNIRYLCGGYYYHFYARFTAVAQAVYTPLLGIPKNQPDKAFFVGIAGEVGQINDQDVWVPEFISAGANVRPNPIASAQKTAEAIKARGLEKGTIATEFHFLASTTMDCLRKELPDATFIEVMPIMEELRAIKTPEELAIMNRITQADSEAIQESFRNSPQGATTFEIASMVEQEMTKRGLLFLWVFTCAGNTMLRSPSEKVWEMGEVLHLDAGGAYDDYLTDVCRMGVRGEPTPLADEIYKACLSTQDKVRAAIKPGAVCGDLFEFGNKTFGETDFGDLGYFIIHGVGLVSHELPRFAQGVERKLEEGMVISVETDVRHPDVGYVKIEDTVAVTADGCVGMGDLGRENWAIVD